jgi:class 3 adenylate cyclase
MNLARFNELLLQSVGVGLAVLVPGTLEVLYRNRRFAEWFPAAEESGSCLDQLLPELDVEALRKVTTAGESFTAEVEVKVRRRTLTLAMEITPQRHADASALLLEAQNISKIRELEYMIESYSQMVEKQNRTLHREKERVERLLLNIMPRTVYEELKTFGVTTPQKFEQASVLMLDFLGFAEMSLAREPAALVADLNDIFTAFDRIGEQFGCERIKTMGDAYVAVSGVPEPNPEHAHNVAKAALLFRRYLERRNRSHSEPWRCRIGLATGPLIGSIVGIQKYVYDIFGPAVNLAARMEAQSGPMQITLPEETYALIHHDFRCTERGVQEIRGIGRKHLFSLEASREPVGPLLP